MSTYSFSRVWLFVTLWTVARQAPLSMGILQARILEWVAMPSSKVIFSTQGLNPGLPHCRQILYHLSQQGSPYNPIVKTKPRPQVTNICQVNIWQILSFSHYKIMPAVQEAWVQSLDWEGPLEKGKAIYSL